MPKKISALRSGGKKKNAAVVDYKEKYKNKKRKESPVVAPAQKKTKENARDPKEFTCPYCEVTITGWVVCRHHIFAKHGVVATRADLLNNNMPAAKILPAEVHDDGADKDSDEDEDELPRGLQDFSEEESGDESAREEEEGDENDQEGEGDKDGWIANALHFWTSHLRKIEEDSDKRVTTQEIFDKNSKKKFRPDFMSKKDYVRHVIAAMKSDPAFEFDEASSSFTSVDVEESEHESIDGEEDDKEEEEEEVDEEEVDEEDEEEDDDSED